MQSIPRVPVTAGAALILAAAAAAASASGLVPVERGTFRLDFEDVDAVLELAERDDVHVLLVGEAEPKRVSDVHLAHVRDWVSRGGVLWATEEGLKSVFVEKLTQARVRGFDFKKTGTGKRGGELVARGESRRLVIHDLPLTDGVDQLYLYPKHRFNGTRDARPLVEMTDEDGNHGLVLAVVPVGRGLVLLDGTARTRKRLPIGRMPGFHPDHPNAVEVDGSWRSYDWPLLEENVRERAAAAFR